MASADHLSGRRRFQRDGGTHLQAIGPRTVRGANRQTGWIRGQGPDGRRRGADQVPRLTDGESKNLSRFGSVDGDLGHLGDGPQVFRGTNGQCDPCGRAYSETRDGPGLACCRRASS